MFSQLRMTIIKFFSMPNLFSFVINMLNQISNDCKKTEHMHVQLKSNVSQEEKKERVRKELYNKAKERRAREGENTFFFFFLFPPNYRWKDRESKHVYNRNSTILFRIRLALKNLWFIRSFFFTRTNLILFRKMNNQSRLSSLFSINICYDSPLGRKSPEIN